MRKRIFRWIPIAVGLYCSLCESMQLQDFSRPDGLDVSRLPYPSDSIICHLSYNVCAGGTGFEPFDTKINFTADGRHSWATRSIYMDTFLKGVGTADLYSFQELSARQVLDIQKSLGEDYKFIVLASHPSDVEAGSIRNTQENLEEITSWQHRNIGTALLGIAYNQHRFSSEEPSCFWLKEEPWVKPINMNSKEGDKGFGNTNTSRAVLGIEFKDNQTQNKFFIFNSHYPISGGKTARMGCAKTEMEQIEKITKGIPWIAAGDRNLIGTSEEAKEVYSCFFNNFMKVRDYRDTGSHYGSGSSWIGFSTDRFKNPVNEDGTFQNRDTLCAMFYSEGVEESLKGVRSAHLLAEFDLKDGRLETNANHLKNPQMRSTVSDHSALVFHFTFKQ